MSSQFRCERILRHSTYRDQFVDIYKEVFAGKPYEENYTTEQVLNGVWTPHVDHGIIMVVTDQYAGGKLVGFGCALPFDKSPADVQDFLDGLKVGGHLPDQFDHRSAWYMSELGVLYDYRGNGAAYELVLQRMRTLDHRVDQYFMRTAAVNSYSKHMYLKIGSQELPILQDVSDSEQVLENKSKSDHRVYLWGNCRTASHSIEQIQQENGYVPFLPPLDEGDEPNDDEPAA